MINFIFNFFVENKEWIFSGVGVSTIAYFLRSKRQKITIHLTEDENRKTRKRVSILAYILFLFAIIFLITPIINYYFSFKIIYKTKTFEALSKEFLLADSKNEYNKMFSMLTDTVEYYSVTKKHKKRLIENLKIQRPREDKIPKLKKITKYSYDGLENKMTFEVTKKMDNREIQTIHLIELWFSSTDSKYSISRINELKVIAKPNSGNYSPHKPIVGYGVANGYYIKLRSNPSLEGLEIIDKIDESGIRIFKDEPVEIISSITNVNKRQGYLKINRTPLIIKECKNDQCLIELIVKKKEKWVNKNEIQEIKDWLFIRVNNQYKGFVCSDLITKCSK